MSAPETNLRLAAAARWPGAAAHHLSVHKPPLGDGRAVHGASEGTTMGTLPPNHAADAA